MRYIVEAVSFAALKLRVLSCALGGTGNAYRVSLLNAATCPRTLEVHFLGLDNAPLLPSVRCLLQSEGENTVIIPPSFRDGKIFIVPLDARQHGIRLLCRNGHPVLYTEGVVKVPTLQSKRETPSVPPPVKEPKQPLRRKKASA